MPKISIITISLNNKNGLILTTQSILKELNDQCEFIIIDGASSDGSLAYIQSVKDQLDYWVSEKDNGIYDAMNKGIRAANGSWTIFMNSGDLFVEGWLDKIMHAINNWGDYGILYGQNFSSKNGLYDLGRPIAKDRNWTLLSFYQGCIPHQSTICKTEILKKFLFHVEYKVASARIFFIETIIQNNVNYFYLPFPISICDVTGISNTNRDLLMQELDDYIDVKYGSRFLLDLKKLDEYSKISERRDTFDLLKYTSGRPKMKCLSDAWSKICLNFLKLMD
jgi:glycosyltransferase involved in cell wall biosynthesis